MDNLIRRGNQTLKYRMLKTIKVKTHKQILLIILTLTAIVYGNGLRNGFVWDDHAFIVEREYFAPLTLQNLISGKYPVPTTQRFRPIRNLLDLPTFALFGLNPALFHGFTILIHLGITSLVYFLALELTRSKTTATISTAIFAFHPIHVEAVTWIIAGLDLIFVVFYLLSLLFYLYSTKPSSLNTLIPSFLKRGSGGVNYLHLSLLFATLALFSHELALTLPLVILAHDFIVNKAKVTKDFHKQSFFPFLVLIPAYIFINPHIFDQSAHATRVYSSFFQTVWLGITLFGQYLQKLILPVNLSVDYFFASQLTSLFSQNHHPEIPVTPLTFSQPFVLVSMFLVTTAVLLGFWSWHHKPLITFCLFWMLVSLIPVLRIFPIEVLFADRYAYVASIGFSLILGILFTSPDQTLRSHSITSVKAGSVSRHSVTPVKAGSSSLIRDLFTPIFLLATLVFYLLIIFTRNQDWYSDYTLWSQTLQKNSESVAAEGNLCVNFYVQKEYQKAQKHCDRLFRLNPYNANPKLFTDLYTQTGDTQKLKEFLQFQLQQDPDNRQLQQKLESL